MSWLILFDHTRILRCGDLSHLHVPDCIWVFFYFVWFVFFHLALICEHDWDPTRCQATHVAVLHGKWCAHMMCKCKVFNAEGLLFFFAGNTSHTNSLYTCLHLKAPVYKCGIEGKNQVDRNCGVTVSASLYGSASTGTESKQFSQINLIQRK